MERFDAVMDSAVEKYVAHFEWWVVIFTPLMYGITLIKNTSDIWSMYQFKNLFLGFALPDVFGVLFIAVALLMLIAKKAKHKRVTALALALSSFVWSAVGVMFVFAIPGNSVWILSAIMVGFNWKIGAEQ